MNVLSYKSFAHTESMQDIKLQADNEYKKIMSQFSQLSPTIRQKSTKSNKMFFQIKLIMQLSTTDFISNAIVILQDRKGN